MEITVTGIDIVQRRLERYADLGAKCAELALRLCEIGDPIIRAAHGGHASVNIEPFEGGYAITANGDERLLIIEFGAGDATGIMASEYDAVPSVVSKGSWSKTHAKMYSTHGFWVFAGHILHEVEPNPSFYYAYQAMVEAIPRIAEEVFAA